MFKPGLWEVGFYLFSEDWNTRLLLTLFINKDKTCRFESCSLSSLLGKWSEKQY